MAPVALLSLAALVAAKLSEARVAPAASLPMAAAQPTIDLDESIAALAARAHVSAHNNSDALVEVACGRRGRTGFFLLVSSVSPIPVCMHKQ